MKTNGLTKAERVHGRSRVEDLFRKGKSGFHYPFRYVYRIESEIAEAETNSSALSATSDNYLTKYVSEAGSAMMVSVPKKNHKRANKRNLLKRRTREAYRLGKHSIRNKALSAGVTVSVAFIYSTKEILPHTTISNAVGKILADIEARF